MVVHVFNPSHDEALAVNKTQYCPSSAARRTGELFWDVAKHWAAPADVILHLPPDGSLRGAEFCTLSGERVPAAAFRWDAVSAIEPWGWDRHIVGIMRRLGAPEALLPSDVRLDAIRQLSSRLTAVRVLEALSCDAVFTSRWCTSPDEVERAIALFGGIAVLKQPWSCSGRGVWRSDAAASQQRVLKTLREQGAVEVEPFYHRLADFAMEFLVESNGGVTYEGLSFFATHEGGAYAGNVLAPQDELRRRLEEVAAAPLPLAAVAESLSRVLADIVGCNYRGPLGVDMMLTPQGIHPCIEVNLRNTMGRVAIFKQRSPLGAGE